MVRILTSLVLGCVVVLTGTGVTEAQCGNGVPAGAETCDDGNTMGGDGCSATCAAETGYVCSGAPSLCCFGAARALLLTAGDASYVPTTGVVVLTDDVVTQRGSVWYRLPIDLRHDLTLRARMSFGTNDALGADGIRVMLHRAPGGLEPEGLARASTIVPQLSIELDTWNNGGDDIAADHASVFYISSQSSVATTVVPATCAVPGTCANIEDGLYHPVVLSWVAATRLITLSLDGVPVLSTTFAGADSLFGTPSGIYLGFFATTGTVTNRQTICPGASILPIDTDEDGVLDALDADDDDDGLPDSVELGGALGGDANANAVPDFLESALIGTCVDDSPTDGVCDRAPKVIDVDLDARPNHLDRDADGDGADDAEEGTADSDGDGTIDAYDSDDDEDGIPSVVELRVEGDVDGDGLEERIDPDDDGDGIATSDERIDGLDTDGDGLASAYDADDDGDGVATADEAPPTRDSDLDGVVDYRDPDDDGDGIATLSELVPPDADRDGIANYLDLDADGDGLSDALEGPVDSDGDGTPDFLEVDHDPRGPGLCAAQTRGPAERSPLFFLLALTLALAWRRGRSTCLVLALTITGCGAPSGADVVSSAAAIREPVFTSVSAGFGLTCAVRADGTIACFGNDSAMQAHPAVGAYAQVSTGYDNACALRVDGAIVCWGNAANGRSTPPPGVFREIAMGVSHGCAITSAGAITCWGDSANGKTTPPPVVPGVTYRAIGAGAQHTCALAQSGVLACWGSAANGRTSPPPGSFVALSVGQDHACAIRNDRSVSCWGLNEYYQARAPSGAFVSVSARSRHTCGVVPDGSITCWGDDHHAKTTPPDGSFIAVSAGYEHTCALRSNGELACWGELSTWEDSGFVGLSEPRGRCAIDADGASVCGASAADRVEGPFTALADDVYHCGLLVGGPIRCWGYDSFGQTTPPAGTFIAIAAGTTAACGVRTDHSLVCWGDDSTGLTTTPPGTFTDVRMHGNFACALRTTGSAICWGGFTIPAPPNTDFVQLDVGDHHACAIDAMGNPTCWGGDGFGQASPPIEKFSVIAAGGVYSCGIRKSDDMPVCWGASIATGWWYPATPTEIEPLSEIFVGSFDVCGLGKYSGRRICWGSNEARSLDRQLVITPAALPIASYDTPFTQEIAVYGGRAPYAAFRIEPGSGALPEGVTIDPATGRIIGRPREAGTFHFRLMTTDADLVEDGQDFTLVVDPVTFRIVSGESQLAVVGAVFSAPMVVEVLGTGDLPLEGVEVELVAPTNGASADIARPRVLTDARGRAAFVARANPKEGAYLVMARVGTRQVAFSLTNTLFNPNDGGVTGVEYEPPDAFCVASPGRTTSTSLPLCALGLVLGVVALRRRRSALFAIILLALPIPAHAQTPAPPRDAEAEARAAFEEGQRFFDSGQFLESARAFERAYELSARVPLLYNMYLAWNAAQELERAEALLTRYVEATPEEDPPLLMARLHWLREEIARRRERAEAWNAQERELEQTEARASDAERRAAEAERARRRSPRRIAAYSLFGAGGALVSLLALSIPMANNAGDDLDRFCGPAVGLPTNVCQDVPELDAIHRSVGRWRVLGWTSAALGTASIVGGVVLILTEPEQASSPVTPDIACASTGCSVGMTVRY